MTTYINGIEKKLFNSKEIRHMIDVKNLILNIKFLNYLLWATVIVILLIKISLSKDKILNSLRIIAKSYFFFHRFWTKPIGISSGIYNSVFHFQS